MITLDFETRSELDLKTVGAWIYSKHKSTDVLCLGFQVGGSPKPELWRPFDPVPAVFLRDTSGLELWAHNSFFEYCIYKNQLVEHWGFPDLPVTQFNDTAALAAAQALPRSLDKLGEALNLNTKKDPKGKRLLQKLSKPRRRPRIPDEKWCVDPSLFDELYQYCEQDVKAEVEAHLKLLPLTEKEKEIFKLDQIINTRGFRVDTDLIDAALEFCAWFQAQGIKRIKEISQGGIETLNQRDRLINFLKAQGVDLDKLTAESVKILLARPDLTTAAREVLTLRQDNGKSSVAKFQALKEMTDPDDNRVRGTMIYHGATTGRWVGAGFQPQNLPRGTIKDVDRAIDLLKMRDPDLFVMNYPKPLEAVSSCIRGTVIATPGKTLFCADFNAIETRVLFWLTQDPIGLSAFQENRDIYREMAAEIYDVELKDVTDDQRQVGKAAILGCGYGMGGPKFQQTCEQKGIKLSLESAKLIVQTYRKKFQSVTKFWRDCERAAIAAVKLGREKKRAGRVAFRIKHENLLCELPSGRALCYPSPYLEHEETEFGERAVLNFMGVNSTTKKWEAQSTYGGKLVENICQAVARDLMAESMLSVEKAGFEVLLSVHDELLTEAAQGEIKVFEQIMSTPPTWAADLPLKASGWTGERYKK